MTYETILVEQRGAVTLITLNRPQALNALNSQVLAELFPALPTAAHFLSRRATGQTRYRARPAKPRPAGTLALPGDAAAMRFLLRPAMPVVRCKGPRRVAP